MSNTLRTLRDDLQAALATGAGMRVLDHLPERIVPPAAILAAGAPYLEGGQTFGSWRVRFTVVLVCSQATNAVATDELDEAVTAAAVALDASGWDLERVEQPTMLAHANTHFLSTTADVVRTVDAIDDGRT